MSGLSYLSGVVLLATALVTTLASPVKPQEPALACRTPGSPLATASLVDLLPGSRLDGVTTAGSRWSETLAVAPGSGDRREAGTRFELDGEEPVEGRYQISDNRICFSYGALKEWSCKLVVPCAGVANPASSPQHAFVNPQSGKITSYFTAVRVDDAAAEAAQTGDRNPASEKRPAVVATVRSVEGYGLDVDATLSFVRSGDDVVVAVQSMVIDLAELEGTVANRVEDPGAVMIESVTIAANRGVCPECERTGSDTHSLYELFSNVRGKSVAPFSLTLPVKAVTAADRLVLSMTAIVGGRSLAFPIDLDTLLAPALAAAEGRRVPAAGADSGAGAQASIDEEGPRSSASGAAGILAPEPQSESVVPAIVDAGACAIVVEGALIKIFRQYNPSFAEHARTEWSGQCVDGAPVGDGTVALFDASGELIWFWQVSPDSGFVLRDGVLNYLRPVSQIEVRDCSSSSYFGNGSAFANINPRIDLASGVHFYDIIFDAVDMLLANCNAENPDMSKFDVRMTSVGYPGLHGTGALVENVEGRYTFDNVASPSFERRSQVAEWNAEMRAAKERREKVTTENRRTARRETLLGELSARVEAYLAGTRPVENIADLMEYDRLRALQGLASGLEIQIIMKEPEFRDGKFIVRNGQKAFDIEAAVSEGQSFNMDEWFRMTQNPFAGQYDVVCLFDANSIDSMINGQSYVVRTKLINSSGKQVVMECLR